MIGGVVRKDAAHRLRRTNSIEVDGVAYNHVEISSETTVKGGVDVGDRPECEV